MRRPSVLVLLFTLGMNSLGLAQTPLGYADALTRAVSTDADLLTARVTLSSAERALAQLRADPLALRVPLLQAEGELKAAQQALRSAELSAQNEVADAYASAVEADTALDVARRQAEIAQTQLDATRIRFEAGAATSLDVAQAQNTLESAERDVSDAQEARDLAYANLSSLLALGEPPELTDTVPAAELPPLEEVLARLEDNRQVVSARQNVTLAEAQLAAVDNAFSARADVDAAQDSLENARTVLAETRRALGLSLRQSYNAAVSAQNAVARAEASLQTARETLVAQQVRFEAGSISQLELAQNQLEVVRAEASLESARHTLAGALRALELQVQGGGA